MWTRVELKERAKAALYDTLSTANGHPGRATQQEWKKTYTEYEEI